MKKNKMPFDTVYADYASSTPISESAYNAMCESARFFFGNPSSLHRTGQAAHELVEEARKNAALLLGCEPEEVIFTSGGTESDNLAIKSGYLFGKKIRGSHLVVTSEIEHPAVLRTVESLIESGSDNILIPSAPNGRTDVRMIEKTLREHGGAALVSLMYANNETGTIQPIKEAAKAAHTAGALFHCDAVQGAGHLMPDVRELGCDLLSVSGHKLHAPKGIGALYVKKGLPIEPIICGGGQERGIRSGTESVPLIAAFGEACLEAYKRRAEDDACIREMRDYIAEELAKTADSKINTDISNSLPGILNISFGGVGGEELTLLCDLKGVEISSGSACSAGHEKASHVLTSMRVPERYIVGAVRISIGRYTTRGECERIINTVRDCVKLIRGGEN